MGAEREAACHPARESDGDGDSARGPLGLRLAFYQQPFTNIQNILSQQVLQKQVIDLRFPTPRLHPQQQHGLTCFVKTDQGARR